MCRSSYWQARAGLLSTSENLKQWFLALGELQLLRAILDELSLLLPWWSVWKTSRGRWLTLPVMVVDPLPLDTTLSVLTLKRDCRNDSFACTNMSLSHYAPLFVSTLNKRAVSFRFIIAKASWCLPFLLMRRTVGASTEVVTRRCRDTDMTDVLD